MVVFFFEVGLYDRCRFASLSKAYTYKRFIHASVLCRVTCAGYDTIDSNNLELLSAWRNQQGDFEFDGTVDEASGNNIHAVLWREIEDTKI